MAPNAFPLFCIASGLILCKNARRTRCFKSESSCNTCFGSPTYKQSNTISVLFLAVQAVTISSSCNRRLQIACFLPPIGNLMQSIYWRAAVCPPQRALTWISVRSIFDRYLIDCRQMSNRPSTDFWLSFGKSSIDIRETFDILSIRRCSKDVRGSPVWMFVCPRWILLYPWWMSIDGRRC